MQINELLKNDSNLDILMNALESFLPIVAEELEITTFPKIIPVPSIDNESQPTFGQFNFVDNVIFVAINNRHIIDILRTLAHELVHYSQNIRGQLNFENGETGSDIENEANLRAGIIMRKFAKAAPRYFANGPISLDESKKKKRPKRKRSINRRWYGGGPYYGITTDTGGDGGGD